MQLTLRNRCHGSSYRWMPHWRGCYSQRIARSSYMPQIVGEGAGASECVRPFHDSFYRGRECLVCVAVGDLDKAYIVPDTCQRTHEMPFSRKEQQAVPERKLCRVLGHPPRTAAILASSRHCLLPFSSSGMHRLSICTAADGFALLTFSTVPGLSTSDKACSVQLLQAKRKCAEVV